MFRFSYKLVLACFVIALVAAPGWAQFGGLQDPAAGAQAPGATPQGIPGLKGAGSGVIVGTVRTLNDKPVANARVTITSLAEGQLVGAQFSGSDGGFTISNLPAGDYELQAESGVQEANERVQVSDGQTWVTLRLPGAEAQGGDAGAPTVSVRQLRVPGKAVSLLEKAQRAISKNNIERAAKYLAKALAAYPDYAAALALRGVLELQNHQLPQAAADANRAIQSDPNYGTGYLVMGAVLNCQRKYQDALRPLQQAEVLLPNAWQGYFESGKALLQLGKYQDALHQANKALSLQDGGAHPELHLVKGYAYLGLRTYAAAGGELQQYLKQAPNGAFAADARASLEKIRGLGAAAGALVSR